MKMACNIDAKGKAVRLVWGVLTLIGGAAAMVWWALPTGGWIAWTVSVVLLTAGVLGIYEARAGWCVVRAMGFRTPV